MPITARARSIFRRHRHSCALLLLLASLCASGGADALEVRIAFIGPADSDAWRGAAQGIAEANAQGRFLGLHYTLEESAGPAVADEVSAIVTAVPAERLAPIMAANPARAVINVTAADDELRADCAGNVLHTLPSYAMREDAVQQWRRKHPESAAVAQAWHADFEKYAAAQLNKRYQDSTGRRMTDEAWAGWAATKVVADVIAREQRAEPDALLDALHGDIAFDGQKGAEMSFRDTGQLRQPLLLVEDGHITGEAPVRGVVDTENLDSLGLSSCLK
ncbi:MAG: ABC transporter substrate-binding protein [Gammaproteobacteria bacterium]